MRCAFTVGLRGSLFGLLAVTSVAALAVGNKLSGPAPAQAVAAIAADAEPTTRLMVRYKAAVKMAGQGGVTVATERHEAAMRVAKTANLSGLPLMDYLKSVSPSVHVVELPNRLSSAETQAAIARMRNDEGVADVAIDHRMKPHRVPNDPRFTDGSQWHLSDSSTVPGGINAAAAWELSSGSGVVVAVLDGGYRPHPDLVTNLNLPGYDFVDADPASSTTTLAGFPHWTANDGGPRDPDASDPGAWVAPSDVRAGFCDLASDSSWHGTHVAGIVAARSDNGRDGLGVAYGARVLPVRVLGRCGGYTSDILAGARWAAGLPVPGVNPTATPAKILNLSLGVPAACDSITQSEIDAIRSRNVSIVASAGNASSSVITLPANCRGVVAVTAHTREGDNANYANVGAGVIISAPGGGPNRLFSTPFFGVRGVMSTLNDGLTVPGNDIFAADSGTSMAAPQVAGVLALVASRRPDLSMATLEGIVARAVRPFPAGSYCAVNPEGLEPGFCGSGLLDAQLAVAAANVFVAPPPAAGGGGCTMAPGGQADAGLPLLALLAALVLLWRRRSVRR